MLTNLWRRKATKACVQVVMAGVGAKDSPLSELLGLLPNTDCRYGGVLSYAQQQGESNVAVVQNLKLVSVCHAVYDYQFVNSDGCIFNKLIFLNW